MENAKLRKCPRTVDEVMDFFSKGMVSKSWASGAQGIVTDDPFEQTEFSFHDDGFWMLDRFYGNAYGSMSFGTTTIFVWDIPLESWQPVWMMNYRGWCDSDAIPFLKQALMGNYRKRTFNGGRGPRNFELDGCPFQYSCITHRGTIGNVYLGCGTSFAQFWGREQIVDSGKDFQIVEEYQFSGGILFPF